MGAFADYLQNGEGAEAALPPESGEFTKGLRAGAYGAGSQLNSLAGLVGENLGLDEFAKGRNDEAGRLQARAQENAPRIGSYKQVNSLRSGADYVSGLIGSSVPVMGAGIAGGVLGGGGGAVRGMLGAAAATAPFEIGDVIQKQHEDPEAMKASPGARLRDAALGGGASALTQGLVPGMVGRQILGKAASSVGKQSIKGIVAHNAMDIPLEGLTEGAGEAIKQYGSNQNKDLDWDAIKENAVGGAAAGGAFGAAGAGADLAHSRAGGVAAGLGNAVGSARTSINDRLASAKQGVVDGATATTAAAGAAPKKFASVSDDIGAFFQKARGAVDDGIDRVAAGQPLGDLKEFASAQGDRAREMMDFSDNESLKKAQVWADEMLNDAGLTPERRQAVSDAVQNIAEPAGRQAMAGLRKAWGTGQEALGKVQALRESFGQRGGGEATGVKKSEDYSGANKAIADQLGPLLERSQPELVSNPQGMADLADGLRQAVKVLPDKHLSSDTIFRLVDALGPDTANTLDAAYRAVGDKNPAKIEAFHKNLKEIAELQQRSATLQDFVGGALTEKSQSLIKSSQLGELVQALVSHARGDRVDPNAGPHQRATQDRQFRELMAEHFGDKADAVSMAIEKEAGIRTKQETAKEGSVDADGDVVTAENLDTIRKGRGANNDAVMHPDLFMANKEPGQNYGAQYLADLQREHPEHNVRFEYEEGSKTHGHAVAEKAADPDALSKADVQGMRLDTKKYPKSKDRIEVGGQILDTRRIAKTMDRKLEYSQADEQSRAHRMARMFNEGVSRLTEQHGNFDVPGTAVIGRVGGKDFTYGEAKALRSDTASTVDGRTETESPDARLKRLERKVTNVELDVLDNGVTDERKQAWLKAKRQLNEAADTDRVARDLESRGIADRSKDEQVHQAAIGQGVNQEPNKSNMDGSGHSHNASDKATKENFSSAVMAAKSMQHADVANVRKVGDRLATLIASAHSMSARDRIKLAAIGEDTSPSKALEIMNPLARKYKDVIAAPGVKGESAVPAKGEIKENPVRFKDGKKVDGAVTPAKPNAPKSVAKEPDKQGDSSLLEKAIAKRQDYLDNPPDSYSTEVAKGHLDWASKQKERVDAEYEKAVKQGDDGDRRDQLSDLRGSLKRLIAKAKAVLEGDASLKDFEEGTLDPKSVAAKKAAFLERAASGDKALIKELSTSSDAKGLQRAAEALPPGKALDAVNARLSELVGDPDVAYGLQTKKYSAQAASPGVAQTINLRANVEAHMKKVLGKSVKVAWANLSHAGEFERMRLNDVIRLSVHALDPMSTAYHESLHAFFAQLRDAKATDITQVLERAAQSEHVMAQLTERFKNEPAVLAQLKNPEERAAYMYQMWASDPTFKVSIAAKTVFGKIAEFIRKTLGIWSNDERALHIMEYFNSGEYAKNLGSPSVVRAALMEAGRNQALETARSMAKPLTNLADAVVSTGTARLRDTDIPALNELADLVKREATDASGKDQGYIAAARIERTKRLNDLGVALEGYTPEHLQEAMNALQRGRNYSGPDGAQVRGAQTAIKAMLRDTHGYMVKAGVEIGDLGADYFPRVWDSHYISKHQTEFKDMLEPYVRSGQFKGNVDDFIRQLGVREGNEFGIETRMPGMQFKKERLLAFIKPEDAAMFVNKDLFATLGSYISQATRRAEWNRRLGGGKLEALFERAKAEGATPEHLKLADNYLKGIDGTLGDDLSPTARRLMGNMIVYQNVRLLPLAMFSSIVDPAGVLVRGGTVKDAWATFKRGMAEIPESFGRKVGSDEGAQMAELVGVIDSALLSSTMGGMYTQGMVGGTAQKINNWFFKANMMEGLNRSFRIGAAEAATKFIARHADGSHSAHSKRWINELGLQAGDVKAMPDGRIALTEADGLSAEQVMRVHAAINQWVDGAVLRPDAADKPLWMNDPHYALISHLKQFVYSFQKTIIGRVAHEAQNGNYTPAMALASYVPIMMAADFAKGLLMGGGDQPEWKKGWGMGDYLGYGVQRAGLLGVGQFGYDVAQDVHRGGVGLGALTGPTIEQFGDAVQLLGGHKQFGPMLLNAMPANALYAHSMGGGNQPDPMFAE